MSIFNANYLNWRNLKRSHEQSCAYITGLVVDVGGGRGVYRALEGRGVRRWVVTENTATKYMTNFEAADVLGDGQHLPFRNSSVDTVLCTQVLEHVVEPERVVLEAYRVLKEGGIFLVSAPFIFYIHAAPDDYYRFSIHGLAYLLSSKCHFEILRTDHNGYVGTCFAELFNGVVDQVLGDKLYLVSMWIFAGANLLGRLFDQLTLDGFTPNYWIVCRKPSGNTALMSATTQHSGM